MYLAPLVEKAGDQAMLKSIEVKVGDADKFTVPDGTPNGAKTTTKTPAEGDKAAVGG